MKHIKSHSFLIKQSGRLESKNTKTRSLFSQGIKNLSILFLILTSTVLTAQTMDKQSIHQFKVTDLYGEEFDFSSLKGKKIMIVNTASECGLTPQYENLQAVYDKYKKENFTIVGFPANNFGAQEPGNDEQIAAFCKKNYGVSFNMMSKISVKGDDMHEIYQFLTQKDKNGVEDSEVAWNFQKYLIDEGGHLVKVVHPTILPDDASIIQWITGE